MKRLKALVTGCLLLVSVLANAQHQFGVKIGAHSSRQRYNNIPTQRTSPADSISSGTDDNFGRASFNIPGFYEYQPGKNVHVQAGLGYRQKGFRSRARLNRRTGFVEKLPDRTLESNLFHYVSAELSLKAYLADQKVRPYVQIGNRLDWLAGFTSHFWGNGYPHFTSFEYSPFFVAGVDLIVTKNQQAADGAILYTKKRALFLEIEGVPRLFNSHRREAGQTLSRVPGSSRYYYVQRIVRNTSFGVLVGYRF